MTTNPYEHDYDFNPYGPRILSAHSEPYDCTSDDCTDANEAEDDEDDDDDDEEEDDEDEQEHRPQWSDELVAQAAVRHTFALVLHDSAGTNSLAQVLNQELVLAVLSFVPRRRRGSLLLCVGGQGGSHTHFGQDRRRDAHEMRSLETFDLDAWFNNEPTAWSPAPPLPLQAGRVFNCYARTAFCSLRDMFVVLCKRANDVPQLWAFSQRSCSWFALDQPAVMGTVHGFVGRHYPLWDATPEQRQQRPRSRVPLLAGSGDRLYLALGTCATLWCYDARTESWTHLKESEDAWHLKTHGAMAIAGDKVVLVGFGAIGWNDSPGLYPDEDRSALQYDPQSDTWTRLPDLPAGFHVDAAASVGSVVVLLGWLGETVESRVAFVEVGLDTAAATPEWHVRSRDSKRGYCGFSGAVSYSGDDGRGRYAMAGGVRIDLSAEDNAEGIPSMVVYSRRVEVRAFPLNAGMQSPSAQGQSWCRGPGGRQAYNILPHLDKSRFMCAVGVL